MHAVTAPTSRPWYREPLVLLVVAIPALTVVAGLTTVYIAGHGADAVVADDYRKDGIAINRDPTRDEAALRLGVGARVSDANGALTVRLEPGRAERPGRLLAILSHATRAELDRMLTLEPRTDGAYTVALPPLNRGHWYVEITPPDRAWRLTGDFVDAAPALTLRPPARSGAD